MTKMENQNEHEHKEHFQKEHWYNKHYKTLLFIPVALLILSLIYLVNFEKKEGDIIRKDVTLTGGTTIAVFDKNADIQKIKSSLVNDFPDIAIRGLSDFRTGEQNGLILETKQPINLIKPALEKYLGYYLNQDNSSIEFSSQSVSQGFYKQLRYAILIAFIFMAIVISLIFRNFVPSIAVIFAAFADIVMTLTVVNLIGLTLSLAGVVAFLLLIGYSVDTDILLTNRVLKKREGTTNNKIFGAFKTGMTMTLTSITAVGVSLLVVYNYSDVLRQMFIILLIGLFFDIVNTWLTNASIIKWYVDKKERSR